MPVYATGIGLGTPNDRLTGSDRQTQINCPEISQQPRSPSLLITSSV